MIGPNTATVVIDAAGMKQKATVTLNGAGKIQKFIGWRMMLPKLILVNARGVVQKNKASVLVVRNSQPSFPLTTC